MDYKIKKVEIYHCIRDFIMDDGSTAYTKGRTYESQIDGCITDNIYDINHRMESFNGFSFYFTKGSDLEIKGSKTIKKEKLSDKLLDFLLFLNDRHKINNYDFCYEKEIKKYLKKRKNEKRR